jgi:hypothetical protein
MDTAEISFGRSQIRVFDLNQLTGLAVNYSTSGNVLGWGLGNSVGVGENPIDGSIASRTYRRIKDRMLTAFLRSGRSRIR